MKNIVTIIVSVLIIGSSLAQARSTKLQLNQFQSEHTPQPFPSHLVPFVGNYLIVDKQEKIAFVSSKLKACTFDVETVVKTIMGTTYYRITYQDRLVLIWDNGSQEFKLIPKDDKITPLRDQIQWHIFLRWFGCVKTMSPLAMATGVQLRFE
jgi:hypothetical protein